jgi:signal recognition particle GTPase
MRAENAAVAIDLADRPYRVLCCGVQGSGKTSVLTRLFDGRGAA